MSILEQILDDFLIDEFAPAWGRDVFWSRFLERRGFSQKADDVRFATQWLPDDKRSRYEGLLDTVKELANSRNRLVHGLIDIGLPMGRSDTPFTVTRRLADVGQSHITTVREMAELVGQIDDVIAELFELIEDG